MSAEAAVPQILHDPPNEELNVVFDAEIVPFSAVVTSTDRDPVSEKLVAFEARAMELFERMSAIQVKDQDSYSSAAETLKEGRAFIKLTTEFFEPIRLVTYGMYQKVLDRKKTIQSSVESSTAVLTRGILIFERAQEEERQRLQREQEAQQRREEQARKIEAATAAEAVGMDEKSIETILDAPSVTPAPVAAPTFQRTAGVSRRENWCAEVFDLHALVKAVAKDKKLLPLLEANMPALNAQARSLKTAWQLPGVKAVDKGSIAVRG